VDEGVDVGIGPTRAAKIWIVSAMEVIAVLEVQRVQAGLVEGVNLISASPTHLFLDDGRLVLCDDRLRGIATANGKYPPTRQVELPNAIALGRKRRQVLDDEQTVVAALNPSGAWLPARWERRCDPRSKSATAIVVCSRAGASQ
jgi:hypothetical protein